MIIFISIDRVAVVVECSLINNLLKNTYLLTSYSELSQAVLQMKIGFTSVHSQVHLIAQLFLIVQPVFSFPSCGLLTFTCLPSLEMFGLVGFSNKTVFVEDSVLEHIQAEWM